MVEQALRLNGLSIPQLVKQLEADGIVCLDNVITKEWLDAARAAVPNYVAAHGEGDFLVADVGNEHRTAAHDLVTSADLNSLFAAVTTASWRQRANSQQIRSALTVRSGWTRKAPASLFHYDASVLTMVIPILIPKAEVGGSGELVVFPNKRPFRRFLVSHAIDKLLTHNSPYRKRLARQALRKPQQHIVDLTPGNAYIFWGYRTLHGNLPCAPGLLRVTLVLHYGEVHRPSPALSLARVLSRWKLANWSDGATDPLMSPQRLSGR